MSQKPWQAEAGLLAPPLWSILNNPSEPMRDMWTDPNVAIEEKNSLVSRWAKLAFWFQPLSGPAGSRPVSAIFSASPDLRQRNRPMSIAGGNGGVATNYTSHTYPTSRKIWETIDFYRELKDVLTTGSRQPN